MGKFFLILALALSGCRTKPMERLPDRTINGTTPPEFYETIQYFRKKSADKIQYHQETCSDFLTNVRKQLYERPSNFLLPKNDFEKKFLIFNNRTVLHSLFELKTQFIQGFQEFQSPSPQCFENIKKTVLAVRSLEDQFLIWLNDQGVILNKESSILKSEYPHTTWPHQRVSYIPQTGDILLFSNHDPFFEVLTRANSSDEVYHHMGMIVQTPEGKLRLLDYGTEQGLLFHELTYLNDSSHTRILVLRMKIAKIAKIAGQASALYFEKNKNEKFQFKTQFVEKAFEFATQGIYQIPQHKSVFLNLKKNKILETFQIATRKIFLPTDLIFDPRFEIIAEYRRINSLESTVQQEAASASIFHWISSQNYEFSNFSLNRNLFLKQYHLIQDLIFQNLKKHRTSQYPTSYRALLHQADEFRAMDCHRMIIYQEAIKYNTQANSLRPLFHDIFNNDLCSPKPNITDEEL